MVVPKHEQTWEYTGMIKSYVFKEATPSGDLVVDNVWVYTPDK